MSKRLVDTTPIASCFPPDRSDTESETSSASNLSSPRFSYSIDKIFPPARSASQSPARLSFSIKTFFHPARSPSQSDGSENYGSLSMEKREFGLKVKATIQVSFDGKRNFFRIREGEKARRKALKIAVGLSGVESSALKGQNRDQIEVTGDNIDTVKLVTLLSKKVGHASIISVVEDKKEEKKGKKKDEPKMFGNGESVDVWRNPWVPWIQNFSSSPRVESFDQSPMMVSQLIDHELHNRNNSLVRDMFSPTSAPAIFSTPIPSRPKPAPVLPTPPPEASSNVNWSKLRKIRGPKRIKIFLWRVAENVLLTRENLTGRMEIPDSTCVLCNMEVESASHLFLRCPIARAIWFAACWGFKSDQLGSTNDIIKYILDPPSDLCQAQDLWLVSLNMAFTLEEIWHTRNAALHPKGPTDLQASIDNIGARLRRCALVFSHSDARMSAHSNVR